MKSPQNISPHNTISYNSSVYIYDVFIMFFEGLAKYTYEHDTETNYTYFGARYYDSDASIFISVDPMSGKYPMLSPYVYVANNPVIYVDPNGMEIDDYFTKYGKYLGSDGDMKSHNIRIVDENTYANLVGINNADGVPILQTSGEAKLFNDAEMTPQDRLSVYQYYNTTGLPLVIDECLSKDAIMAYNTGVKIKIPVERNKSKNIMNNFYNIKSTFNHEEKHYLDHKALGTWAFINDFPTLVKELDAIWYERSQPDFKNTTSEYKNSNAQYLNKNFQKLLNGSQY